MISYRINKMKSIWSVKKHICLCFALIFSSDIHFERNLSYSIQQSEEQFKVINLELSEQI